MKLSPTAWKRFLAKTKITEGCWLWTGTFGTRGYGQFRPGRAAEGQVGAHRAAWAIFFGEFDQKLFVLHRCDTPACVNPAHLFLGTHQDNMQDMTQKGRHPRGNAKLSPADVDAIRASTDSHRALARRFGVNEATVRFVRKGATHRGR